MKLPEIFKNKININSNKKISIEKEEKEDLENLPKKVQIIFKNNTKKEYTIVYKTTHYLITNNNNIIHISDIKEIKKT